MFRSLEGINVKDGTDDEAVKLRKYFETLDPQQQFADVIAAARNAKFQQGTTQPLGERLVYFRDEPNIESTLKIDSQGSQVIISAKPDAVSFVLNGEPVIIKDRGVRSAMNQMLQNVGVDFEALAASQVQERVHSEVAERQAQIQSLLTM
ncbi:hypothetical protein FJZ27_02990 [Candidatus Peribacteria bacterium]|nr:hypothetical protein [Candidatus Peribacteria bacterium]